MLRIAFAVDPVALDPSALDPVALNHPEFRTFRFLSRVHRSFSFFFAVYCLGGLGVSKNQNDCASNESCLLADDSQDRHGNHKTDVAS